MTIVNKTHKFIFVHVPKTAGSSVKQYLLPCAGEGDVHVLLQQGTNTAVLSGYGMLTKHSTAMEIRDVVGRKAFNRAFKFAVVRNPFARTVSIYRFLKYKFRNWDRASVMDSFGTLEEFVTSEFFRGPGPGGIFRPQIRWLSNLHGRLCMDYICRVETLDEDMAYIGERLALPIAATRVEKRNVSGGDLSSIASELKSNLVVAAIRQRYTGDFELLDYACEPDDALLRRVETQKS